MMKFFGIMIHLGKMEEYGLARVLAKLAKLVKICLGELLA